MLVLTGRGFVAADANKGATAVIVDQPFADEIGGGMYSAAASGSSMRAA